MRDTKQSRNDQPRNDQRISNRHRCGSKLSESFLVGLLCVFGTACSTKASDETDDGSDPSSSGALTLEGGDSAGTTGSTDDPMSPPSSRDEMDSSIDEGREAGQDESSGDTESGLGTEDTEDEGSSFRFDVASDESGSFEPNQGCDKVDFLFVIDNSASMAGEQSALIASFPGFIDSIKSTLPEDGSYHIMVTDTDAMSRCTEQACANPSGTVQKLCIDDGMDGYACSIEYTECDMTIGAGVVHPAGKDSSNQLCDVPDGLRYLKGDDPKLKGNFDCVGRLGVAGNGKERPMDAMLAALAPEINAVDGCNEGFLRDDAVLVITFISDDPNYEDAGTPQEWHDAVMEAKFDNPDAAVVLGVTQVPPDCRITDGKTSGEHWREFVSLFGDRGLQGRICDEDYSPFFNDAVAIVKDACDDFIPPG